MTIEKRLAELTERWKDAEPTERANAQLYLTELAEALGVTRPGPRGSGFEFELPIQVVNRDGSGDAPGDLVERHLETLEIVGELRRDEDGRYRAPAPAGEAA